MASKSLGNLDPVATKNAFEELEAAKGAFQGQAESFGQDIKADSLVQRATMFAEKARIEVTTGAIVALLETKSHLALSDRDLEGRRSCRAP